MGVGERISGLRKAINLTQDEFAQRLRINKGTVSNLEKTRQNPSDQLIRLICLEFVVSEDWLKSGDGEMFISPEEVLKSQKARMGERAFMEAVNNIMKENGLAMAAGRPAHRQVDPELNRIIEYLTGLWASDDDRLKTWAAVQFEKAFPDINEAQKKQQDTSRQASAG